MLHMVTTIGSETCSTINSIQSLYTTGLFQIIDPLLYLLTISGWKRCLLSFLLVIPNISPVLESVFTGIYEKILEVIGLQGFAFIYQIFWRCGRDSNPRPRA